MIFEVGKTYQHNDGARMTIIGRLKTHIYGECLIGECDTGELVPVGETEGHAVNWHEQVRFDEGVEKMTYKENITAILECCFAGFKEEIIEAACNRILELEPFINKPCVSKGACYEDKIKQGYGMIETIWEDVDKEEISKSVMLLDLFTKTFCRYRNDYERFNDLKFRCDECPFQTEAGSCKVKKFKAKYAPNYRDFGSRRFMMQKVRMYDDKRRI